MFICQGCEMKRKYFQKRCKKFYYAGASTACTLVAFSATFGYCLLPILHLSVIIMKNCTNSEMTNKYFVFV
jgi:hypothetical protein